MTNSNGKNPGQTWLLLSSDGQLQGPLTTSEILARISEGRLQGEERVKPHPDGSWIQVTQNEEFYDALLGVLANPRPKNIQKQNQEPDHFSDQNAKSPIGFGEEKQKQNPESAKGHENFPVESPFESISPKKEEDQNQDDEKTEISLAKSSAPKQFPSTDGFTQSQVPQAKSLKGTTPSRKNQSRSKAAPQSSSQSVFIGLLLVSSVALFFIAFQKLALNKERDPRPRLLKPDLSRQVTLETGEQKKLLSQAITLFFLDHHEAQIAAQNKLVNLLEGAPLNLEGRAILCLVQKELWPFVRQDSHDVDAVQTLSQSTRSLDPVGINGMTCQISQLLIMGKIKEAKGIVDYALNQPQFSTTSHLFAMKAEVLDADKDFKSAYLYAEKAAQLWPQWLKAHYLTAIFAAKDGKTSEATKAFDAALKINPQHRSTLIEYGGLLFERLRDTPRAYQLLTLAQQIQQKILKRQEARMFYLLALLEKEKSSVQKALTYARKAYELQSSNNQYKDLLMQMGGSTDLRQALATNNELVLLGDQYARAGDCLSAQAEYKAAFDVDSKNALAAMKAAKCLWQINLVTDALNWLNKSVQADPKLAMAYYALADYYSQRFQFQASVQILNRGSKELPQHYEILRGYGLVELRRNNLQDAITYLGRALKIYPNDVETLILLAKANFAKRELQPAQAYALKAIEIDSTSVDAQVIYARILGTMRGVDAAEHHLTELINRFSYTLEFRLALGELNKDADRLSQSQKIYEQILIVDPRNKKALLGLSDSFRGQGFFEKALKAVLDAAILDPSDALPLIKAGQIYLESGKYKEAIIQFERGLKLNPQFPLAHVNIGRAAFLAGNLDLALKSAQAERQINPNLVDSFTLAAEVFMTQRDYVKCTQEYQQALRIDPRGSEKYIKIARCYRLSGSLDIAESMLNLAVREESGRAEIYKEQGAVFEQKGDRRAAVEAYNRYITLSPNAPDKKEIEFKITEIGGTISQ